MLATLSTWMMHINPLYDLIARRMHVNADINSWGNAIEVLTKSRDFTAVESAAVCYESRQWRDITKVSLVSSEPYFILRAE